MLHLHKPDSEQQARLRKLIAEPPKITLRAPPEQEPPAQVTGVDLLAQAIRSQLPASADPLAQVARSQRYALGKEDLALLAPKTRPAEEREDEKKDIEEDIKRFLSDPEYLRLAALSKQIQPKGYLGEVVQTVPSSIVPLAKGLLGIGEAGAGIGPVGALLEPSFQFANLAYRQFIQDYVPYLVKNKGISYTEAMNLASHPATVIAFAEGGVELASTVIELLLGGVGGKVVTQAVKRPLKRLLKRPVVRGLASLAGIGATEGAEEFVQGGVEAAVRRATMGEEAAPHPLEAGWEAAKIGFGAGVLLGTAGAANVARQAMVENERARTLSALNEALKQAREEVLAEERTQAQAQAEVLSQLRERLGLMTGAELLKKDIIYQLRQEGKLKPASELGAPTRKQITPLQIDQLTKFVSDLTEQVKDIEGELAQMRKQQEALESPSQLRERLGLMTGAELLAKQQQAPRAPAAPRAPEVERTPAAPRAPAVEQAPTAPRASAPETPAAPRAPTAPEEISPPKDQATALRLAQIVRDFWNSKKGTYKLSKKMITLRSGEVTSAQQFNEERASKRAATMQRLIDRSKKRPLTEKEIKFITDEYKRARRIGAPEVPIAPVPAPKGGKYAVQEQEATPIPVGKAPEVSPKVGEEIREEAKPSIKEIADRLVAEAEAELKERLGGKLYTGFDPTLIPPLAKLVAGRILQGGYSLAKATEELVARVGEAVREHVPKIWEEANRLIDEAMAVLEEAETAPPKEAAPVSAATEEAAPAPPPPSAALTIASPRTPEPVQIPPSTKAAFEPKQLVSDRDAALHFFGLPFNASEQEIKERYRELAKRFHPDRHPGAEEQFKQLQRHYEVLGGDSGGERRFVIHRGDFNFFKRLGFRIETPLGKQVYPEVDVAEQVRKFDPEAAKQLEEAERVGTPVRTNTFVAVQYKELPDTVDARGERQRKFAESLGYRVASIKQDLQGQYFVMKLGAEQTAVEQAPVAAAETPSPPSPPATPISQRIEEIYNEMLSREVPPLAIPAMREYMKMPEYEQEGAPTASEFQEEYFRRWKERQREKEQLQEGAMRAVGSGDAKNRERIARKALKRFFGIDENHPRIQFYSAQDGNAMLVKTGKEGVVSVRINLAYFTSVRKFIDDFEHEIAHGVERVIENIDDIVRTLPDETQWEIVRQIVIEGYKESEYSREQRTRALHELTKSWRHRKWYEKAIGVVQEFFYRNFGTKLTRLAAERIATKALVNQLRRFQQLSGEAPEEATQTSNMRSLDIIPELLRLPYGKPLLTDLRSRLNNTLNPVEMELLKFAGLDEFLSQPRTMEELERFIEEKAPKVTIHKLPMRLENERDRLEKEWLDKLSNEKYRMFNIYMWAQEYLDAAEFLHYPLNQAGVLDTLRRVPSELGIDIRPLREHPTDVELRRALRELMTKISRAIPLDVHGKRLAFLNRALSWAGMTYRADAIEDAMNAEDSDAALSRIEASVPPDQRILFANAVELYRKHAGTTVSYYNDITAKPINEPMPNWTLVRHSKNLLRVDVTVSGDVLELRRFAHTTKDNTIGWAAIQFVEHGDKRVAFIIELQSDWAQRLRDAEQRIKYYERRLSDDLPHDELENLRNELQRLRNEMARMEKHPILKVWTPIVIKAAIEAAIENNATHIAISDAETALMTETYGMSDVEPRTLEEAERDAETNRERYGRRAYIYPTIDGYAAIPGFKGYLFNYGSHDPKLTAEARGQRKSVAQEILENLTGDSGKHVSFGEHRYGNFNIVLLDKEGKIKRDASGFLYSLENVNPKSFTMTRKDKVTTFHAGFSPEMFDKATEKVINAVKEAFRRPDNEAAIEALKKLNVTFSSNKEIPEFQPYEVREKWVESPIGTAMIPVIGKLLDPRAFAYNPVERAITVHNTDLAIADAIVTAVGIRMRMLENPFEQVGSTYQLGDKSWAVGDLHEEYERNGNTMGLSPEQEAYVKQNNRIVKAAQDYLRREGFTDARIALIAEDYGIEMGKAEKFNFPRPVIGRDGKLLRDARSSPFKLRAFEKESIGIKEGFIYEPDAQKRAIAFLHFVYSTIAARDLANNPALKGETKAERLEMLKHKYPDADEADLERAAANPSLGYEGVVHHPIFYGRIFPKEIADRLNKHYKEGVSRWMRNFSTVNNASKSLMLAIDLSAMILQGQVILFRHPEHWAKGTTNMFKALADPRVMQKLMESPEFAEGVMELAQLGVSMGNPQDFMIGAETMASIIKRSKIAEELPILKAGVLPFEVASRMFTTYIDVATVSMWNAMKRTVPKEQWHQLAEQIQNMLGKGKMEALGLSRRRVAVERFLALAPSFLRGNISLAAEMFSGRITGSQARKAMIAWVIGAHAAFIAFALAFGLEWDDIEERMNPASSNYLTLPIQFPDGRYRNMGLGGAQRSLLRLIGDITETAISHPEDFKTLDINKNPISKWLRGKAAPFVSLGMDMLTGTDFLGREVNIPRALVSRFVPLAVQQLVPWKDEPEPTISDVAPAFIGMQSYPETVREGRMRDIRRLSRERYQRPYSELTVPERADVMMQAQELPSFQRPLEKVTPRSKLFMSERAEEREEKLFSMLEPDIQKRLRELGLRIGGVTPYQMYGGQKVIFTPEELETYLRYVAEEANAYLRHEPFERMTLAQRQERLKAIMNRARRNARLRMTSTVPTPSTPSSRHRLSDLLNQ